MTVKILQKEERVLRETATTVPPTEISSPKIKKVILEMKEALESQDDGVAIAAPQIGHSLRIFVVSHRVDEIIEEARIRKVNKISPDIEVKVPPGKDQVYINPVIRKVSKEKKSVEEGCLSVRFLYGRVKRSTKATVSAYDENGNKFERGGTGLLAQIFQHEVDHLDGILFIDKAQNVEEIFPDDYKNDKRKSKK